MITPNDIMDRLEELVGEQFPGEKIYRDLVESDFTRPSNLLEHMGSKVNVGFGSNMVEMLDKYKLTTFVEVDPYHNSHLADLHTRQMKIIGLLIPGYIKVKDRAPKVVDIETGGGFDFDEVTVTLSYTLDRNDFLNIPQMPMVRQLHTKEEVYT